MQTFAEGKHGRHYEQPLLETRLETPSRPRRRGRPKMNLKERGVRRGR